MDGRIAGVDIPRDKPVAISLRYLYGIGPSNALKIIDQARVEPTTRVRDLTDDEVNRLREIIDKQYVVEGDLRREVRQNIQRLIDIQCYRGL
ncbi:MAG TPA: 30S ribosomal protein S13, partial [Dehalococcoidia bacterium]|nr:30S ribosomal protein S13 [Dehalococcoidia bacterium]